MEENEMSDLTPPPEEPMSDHARARIREQLLRGTYAGAAAPTRRWVVPGLAAAAVVLVAAMAAWAVQLGGDGGSDGAPVASTSSVAPTVAGSEKPREMSSSAPPEEAGQVGRGACPDELTHVLPGAEEAVSFPASSGGMTSFWVKGDRFVLCDERAGITTVHHPLPLTPVEDTGTYRVSSIYPPAAQGYRTIRVAGGVVPDGAMAFDVRYTFPDGHTEAATNATDDQGRTWWRMAYEYQDGGGNELDQPPIEVTVSFSGVQHTYTLDWAVDTCAQANHGC
jgi:hypothetical protein